MNGLPSLHQAPAGEEPDRGQPSAGEGHGWRTAVRVRLCARMGMNQWGQNRPAHSSRADRCFQRRV